MVYTQFLCGLCAILFVIVNSQAYKAGVGKADCTGPSVEVTLMGYAKLSQKGCGIHLRQYSRAFVFDDGQSRFAFVSVDAAMISHSIKKSVLNNLGMHYQNLYSFKNVIISGTHTHSTPGGFNMYFLYDIPTFGFVAATFEALVSGITKSIIRAHENLVEADVRMSFGDLFNVSINRSPQAYLLNPPEERAAYQYDVDHEMVQLNIRRVFDQKPLGSISWYSVHGTSMNSSNCLVTSDNLGYASLLFEKAINSLNTDDEVPFVAAFASSNEGDVSPNIKGPHCLDTGEPCDNVFSTCGPDPSLCVSFGPGSDMFDSTKIIATRLFNKAQMLWNSHSNPVKGKIKYVHQFVNMPEATAYIHNAAGELEKVHGCLPALGYSFAAGTTDGTGEFRFHQGSLKENTVTNTLRNLLFVIKEEDVLCHSPKPILINSGRASAPYSWQPNIVSTQIVALGNVILIAVPGEFTTMSGRRLRRRVEDVFGSASNEMIRKVVITGLSNTYSSYITTPEEYDLQRYEGASTIYGPHTLTLYLDIFQKLALAIKENSTVDPGPTPVDMQSKLVSFTPPVLFDSSGIWHNFGFCTLQPPLHVKRGTVVSTKFVAGNPRNNFMQVQTYLKVEKLLNDSRTWRVIADDSDWFTKFYWRKSSILSSISEVTIEWTTDPKTDPGVYRISHFGYFKYILGGTNFYMGKSKDFNVI